MTILDKILVLVLIKVVITYIDHKNKKEGRSPLNINYEKEVQELYNM